MVVRLSFAQQIDLILLITTEMKYIRVHLFHGQSASGETTSSTPSVPNQPTSARERHSTKRLEASQSTIQNFNDYLLKWMQAGPVGQ